MLHQPKFLLIVLVYLLVETKDAAEEILYNPDFEEPFSDDDWSCSACVLIQDSSDSYTGMYSGRVFNRSSHWAGVTQYVDLASHTNYFFTIHIKFLNQLKTWTTIELFAEIRYHQSGGGNTEYLLIGELPHYFMSDGWQKLGGDFYLDSRSVSFVRLYVQVDDPDVEYLVDTASLTAFYLSPNWRDHAYEQIEDIRKNNITINLQVQSEFDPADLLVELNQTSHAFPFGSAIVNYIIGGDTEYDRKYQDCFYSNFNWAVSEGAMKWHVMEPVQYEIAYPDESVRRLNERGVPLRGHCVFWGKEEFVPEWLLNMTAEEVDREMQRRMDYLVPHYAGQIEHWDVNNEQLHGIWFEETTQNPSLLSQMFHDVRARDANVLLFFNDYNIVSSSRMTQAYVQQVKKLENKVTDIGGVGVQSHLNGYPDIVSINKRLEVLEATGKRLWITELDIAIDNEYERADAYEDMMTLYFSNKNIDGILLWGFSDNHHWKPNAALFEGDDFEPNAAGRRWQHLLGERWRTVTSYVPASANDTFLERGFYGGYDVKVLHCGVQIHSESIVLETGSSTTIDIII